MNFRRSVALASSVASFASLALVACGGGIASSPTQTAPIAAPDEGAGAGSSAPSAGSGVKAMPSDPHALTIAAASCWFGGVWGDALGESADQRKANGETRCRDVVRRVWGEADKTHYEQLRALDGKTIDDVVTKVGADSGVGRELRALADAQREALEARRAGDKVKRDVAREPDKLTKDEAAAVGALANAKALDALLKLDDGEYTHEAHALGVMTAMERLESSRGLPKHMKVYAMEGPMGSLFGVAAPALPDDASKPLAKGMYLSYVSDAAKAAGHPVPDSAKTPKEREPLAWAGVLQGISEKLKADVDAIAKDTPFAEVAAHVVHRLEAQYQAETNALATKSATAAAPATTAVSATPAAAAKTPAVAPKGPAATPVATPKPPATPAKK